jgi:hypothetical protein
MSAFQYWMIGGTLAAGLAFVGAIIALGHAWYPDVVREQLGTYLAEGNELLRIAQLEEEPVAFPAAAEWNLRVVDYLASALGQSFVHRFDDSSPLPGGLSTLQWDPHRKLEFSLRTRIARIERFLSELE